MIALGIIFGLLVYILLARIIYNCILGDYRYTCRVSGGKFYRCKLSGKPWPHVDFIIVSIFFPVFFTVFGIFFFVKTLLQNIYKLADKITNPDSYKFKISIKRRD